MYKNQNAAVLRLPPLARLRATHKFGRFASICDSQRVQRCHSVAERRNLSNPYVGAALRACITRANARNSFQAVGVQSHGRCWV